MPLPANLQGDWPVISQLLDEALTLSPAQRAAFLDRLPAQHAPLRATLHQLLTQAEAVETAEFLATLPRFTPGATRGPLAELAIGDTIGPYRLLAELGTGGMGAVWLAERSDGQLKRRVALKLPRLAWVKGLAERMARERDILATLEHPNIARLYDAGLDAMGRPYLALEYVEGQPIDVYAKERGLGVRDKLQLLLQVCNAVAYAHSRLVVHRDLKPSNILVTADGQVRLLDFGIAKLMAGDAAAETQLTQLAGRALTLDYASPEQIRGEPIGTASDVYSLGVVAYELLTGAKPYKLKRASAAELEEAIATADPRKASDAAPDPSTRRALKGDLDAVLNKALAKSTKTRYVTVDALAHDLEAYAQGQPVSARSDTLAYRTQKWARRHPLALGIAAAVLLSLSAGAYAQAAVMTALSAGALLAAWQWRRAVREAKAAASERDRVRLALEANEQVQEFVTSLFAVPDPPDVKYIDDGLQRIRTQQGKLRDAVRARMLIALARLYASLGRNEKAREVYEEAAELAVRVGDFGAGGEALALLAVNQADETADYEHARATAARALALGEEHSPDDGRLLARANDAMAVVLTNQGKYAEAMAHAETSVRLHGDVSGAHHVQTLSARSEVARLLHRTQQHARAEAEYRRLLEETVRELGAGHPVLLTTFENFGSLLEAMKKFDEAEAVLREAIAIRAERLGPDHPTANSGHSILGRTLLSAGKPQEAAVELERSLILDRLTTERPNRMMVYTTELLIAATMDAGRYADARSWLRCGDELAQGMTRDAADWRRHLYAHYQCRLMVAGVEPDERDPAMLKPEGGEPVSDLIASTMELLRALDLARTNVGGAMERLRKAEASARGDAPRFDDPSRACWLAAVLSQARLARAAGDLSASTHHYQRALQEPLSSPALHPRFLPAALEWANLLGDLGREDEQRQVMERLVQCAPRLAVDSPPRLAVEQMKRQGTSAG